MTEIDSRWSDSTARVKVEIGNPVTLIRISISTRNSYLFLFLRLDGTHEYAEPLCFVRCWTKTNVDVIFCWRTRWRSVEKLLFDCLWNNFFHAGIFIHRTRTTQHKSY